GGRRPAWEPRAGLGQRRAGNPQAQKITVHFINNEGVTLTTKGKVGDSLLDVVVKNNLDIDGFGACEGTLASSTCHFIFEDHIYEKLETITDENDMLHLAYGLTDRSRWRCQICLTKSYGLFEYLRPWLMPDNLLMLILRMEIL
uniref:Adrenodoxin, mitochondrial n=1 Tax=Urocitellus parryii TaxID=9999 RepID=A0A8D2IPD9_UROPR